MTETSLESRSKPFWKSLTINASLVTGIVSGLALFGINISPDAVPQLQNVVTGIAAAVAIFGRLRARTLID